jgi:hypothetical protein
MYLIFFFCCITLIGCTNDNGDEDQIESTYSGTFRNLPVKETFIGAFGKGIYLGDQIPEELEYMDFGRLEIDFRYMGGGLEYFAPLFYFGSMNKDTADDAYEEPQFHLAIEIGHYNVIPVPVENLFYTICTHNYPQYCRDTYFPVISGISYTLIVDKKPEGIILQLKEGEKIVNIFPDAFFPDSSQMFFRSVSEYTDAYRGDSLRKVMMIGKGFAGIEKGIHEFNGEISGVRIFKYTITSETYEYEIMHVRNQHVVSQHIAYSINDNLVGNEKSLVMNYEFWPYRYKSGKFFQEGAMQSVVRDHIQNNESLDCILKESNMGFYRINIKTLDENGALIGLTSQPFEIWIYPREWNFEFY